MEMRRDQFEQIVLEAIEALPAKFLKFIENVDVVVEGWPTKVQLHLAGVSSGNDIFGMYEGVPLTSREQYNLVLPDKISVFQGPIENKCNTLEDVVLEVQVTVAHEVAHHFGISDEILDGMGLGFEAFHF